MQKIKGLKVLLMFLLVLSISQFLCVDFASNSIRGNDKNKWTSTFVKKSEDQTLVVGLMRTPYTLDPNLNEITESAHIINNTFEGLVREINGRIEPAMAKSYSVSKDGLIYTFILRDDAKWSDGTSVTAYDFDYAWNRVVNNKGNVPYDWMFDEAHIKTWTALDASTFQVTLYEPTPYFIGMTAFYTFFPVKESVVDDSWDGIWSLNYETAVSNGPFKLKSFGRGRRIVIEPNPHYWQKENVKLSTVEFVSGPDEYMLLGDYRLGYVDVLDSVPSYEIATLREEDPEFEILPQDATYYYVFNKNLEVLNDVRVRKALSLAIDRSEIVEDVLGGGQFPAHSLMPDNYVDHNSETFNQESGDYDIKAVASIEQAQALLAEAGYPKGHGFPTFQISMNDSLGHMAIAEAIQKMWKNNLGIDVTIESYEWTAFQDARRNGEFEIARAGWIGDYTDPMTYLDMFTMESDMNFTNWNDEAYETYIEASKIASGQDRFELLYKAESILSNSYVVMPIYHYSDVQMISGRVSGLDKTSRSIYYFGQAKMLDVKP